MNQDDFRRLLASGGGGSGGGNAKNARNNRGEDRITHLDADGIRKLSAKKKHSGKPHASKPSRARAVADDDDDGAHKSIIPGNQYRDRAAERRYGGVDVETAPAAGPPPVKGLDFALLAQLKREKEKLLQATAAERSKVAERAQDPSDTEPTFQSRMGRLVYFHACQHRPLSANAPLVKSEHFFRGRTSYTFKLEPADAKDIPITVHRSKEDCPQDDSVVRGLVNDLVISDVAQVMANRRAGIKNRSYAATNQNDEDESKRQGVESAPDRDITMTGETKPSQDDDDEDIFADVGEYVPAYLRQDELASNVQREGTRSRDGYFSNLSASITDAEEAARRKEKAAAEALNAALKKAAETQARINRELEAKAREERMLGSSDSYGEYQDVDADEASDDENDKTKKRKGADKEVNEDEAERRKKQKKSSKMENDLKKINELMESTA